MTATNKARKRRRPAATRSGETIPVPDERAYLALAGMKWMEPEERR